MSAKSDFSHSESVGFLLFQVLGGSVRIFFCFRHIHVKMARTRTTHRVSTNARVSSEAHADGAEGTDGGSAEGRQSENIGAGVGGLLGVSPEALLPFHAGPVGETQPQEEATIDESVEEKATDGGSAQEREPDVTAGIGAELLGGPGGGGGGPTVGVPREGQAAGDGGPGGKSSPEEADEQAQGSQPASEGGQGGEGGDESQRKYREFSVPSSILPLCVLHQSTHHRKSPPRDIVQEDLSSHPMDDDNFPDFVNAPVNLRSELQQTKLNCSGKANLFKAYVENRDPAHSPILGSLTATVSSFNVVTNDHTMGDEVVLKSVNRKTYDLQLAPINLTVEHIGDALRWLEADKYEKYVAESVQSGMMEYFQALQRVNINGDESQLENFIRNHTWEGPSIWFGNILDELHYIEVAKRKRMLRRFIHENLAWMTKISLLLIDGLHRTATIDGATIGVVPAGASDDLVDKTAEFQKLLTYQNDGTRNALALGLEKNTVSMDSLLTVGIKFPHDQVDAKFCSSMKMLSGKMQHNQGKGESHSSKQIMHFIITSVREEMPISFPPGFLLGNNNETGLPLAWKSPLTEKEIKTKSTNQREILSKILLQSDFHKDVVTAFVSTIVGEIKPHEIGEYYIKCWVEQFQLFLRRTLCDMAEKDEFLASIAQELGISKIVEKNTEDWWEKIFRKHDDSNGYGDFTIFPNSYKKSTFLSMLGDRRDPFASNRYGRKGYEGTSLEFVWIVLWSFSSEGTYDGVEKFFSEASPDTFAYPQASVGTSEQMTRFFTCFMQVISCSVLASKSIWKKGFLNKRKPKKKQVEQIGDLGLYLILLISGVRYSIQFFEMIGVDPKPKWFVLDSIPELQEYVSFDKSNFMNRWGGDLVVLYTTAFCWSLSRDYQGLGEETIVQVRLYECLKRDFPREHVIISEDVLGKLSSNGDVTIGGSGSYDLRKQGTVGSIPVPNLCEVCSGPYACDGHNYTHRMLEFVPLHPRDEEHDESKMPQNNYFDWGIFRGLLEKRNKAFVREPDEAVEAGDEAGDDDGEDEGGNGGVGGGGSAGVGGGVGVVVGVGVGVGVVVKGVVEVEVEVYVDVEVEVEVKVKVEVKIKIKDKIKVKVKVKVKLKVLVE